jgi:hypothetical protein
MLSLQKRLLTVVHAALFCLFSLLCLFLLLCLFSLPAFADMVSWKSVYQSKTLTAGPLTCLQTVTSLACKRGERPLFAVPAFADHLAVSENEQYIVGLANRGLVPLFWLRNLNGEPIDLSPASTIHFCRMSVTNVRDWFEAEQPDVKFKFDGDKLTNVVVKGCDGREVLFHAGGG